MQSPEPSRLSPTVAAWLPSAAAALIGALSLTGRVQANDVLRDSLWAAAALLVLWNLGLVLMARRSDPGGMPVVESSLRPQHYIQAICQLAVFAYWGWYWRPVYDTAALIGAQLAFAYGFGMLLTWSRGGRYRLGFGPFPIIFSINLFLWFRDDWFYLQFLMIAVGFVGKELIQWRREGRRVHVFNPSALALGLFSLVLIATGATELTWGQEIASTLSLAPRIYLFLFLVGLVVMYFFSITLIAAFAAAVLFGLSAAYSAWAGVPYFVDSEIPAAVFLGLHLLVTDPSTSPRTPLGKAMFGALYGFGVFALYAVLGAAGAPTFYDKLLCVPLLNLSVRAIDHLVRQLDARGFVVPGVGGEAALLPRARWWSPARLNLAHIAVWVAFFGLMAGTGRTDARHAGDSVPFWELACLDGRRNACDQLVRIEASYCADNSAWACNELGIHHSEGRVVQADSDLSRGYFSRACELRFQAACINLLEGTSTVRARPRALDLRLLLREGGLNLMEMSEPELLRRACDHSWSFACERTASPS